MPSVWYVKLYKTPGTVARFVLAASANDYADRVNRDGVRGGFPWRAFVTEDAGDNRPLDRATRAAIARRHRFLGGIDPAR